MKKVLFILPSLRGGGAERVMVTLLKYLDRNKFDLHLALISKEGPY
ncbi:glycosyltransferase, partial [Parageobacillus sp. SY1]